MELGRILKHALPNAIKRKLTNPESKKREWLYINLIRKNQNIVGEKPSYIGQVLWDDIRKHFAHRGSWNMTDLNSGDCIIWTKVECDKINGIDIIRIARLYVNHSMKFSIHGKEISPKAMAVQSIAFSKDITNFKYHLTEILETFENLRICKGFEVDVDKSTFNMSGQKIGICEKWNIFNTTDKNYITCLRHRAINCQAILVTNSQKQIMCGTCSHIKHNSFYSTLSEKEDVIHINKRETYMSEKEKHAKLQLEKGKRRQAERRESLLSAKINNEMHNFDQTDNNDLTKMFSLVDTDKLGEDMKLFYQIQLQNLKKKNGRGYRWHPK